MSIGTNTVKAKTLTVKNSAKTGVLTGNVAPAPAPFTVTVGGGHFSLPAGQKATVTVQYAPTAAKVDSGTLVITSNDPKKPSVSVKLSGTGAAGKLSVPTKLGFLKTTVNTSSEKILTIKNAGLGVLHGHVGTSTGAFAVKSGDGDFELNNKQGWPVTIQFAPPAKGNVTGTLPITSDDPKHLSLNVSLKGAGK
jgi:hypothetical protein